jgi:hypothetical protein
MVLVLFSVTFFTETNQKRDKESLSFIRAISATSVSLPAAPIPPYYEGAVASFTVIRPWLYYSFKRAAILSDLFSGSKLPNTFDTDDHRHNELLFHYPREHKFDIKCLQLLDG